MKKSILSILIAGLMLSSVTISIATNMSGGNEPPSIPYIECISGKFKVGEELKFQATSTDPEGDEIDYRWDWGDGNVSDWLEGYPSGEACVTVHTYTEPDTYTIKVKARDEHGAESENGTYEITVEKSVSVGTCFLAGSKITMADKSYKKIEDVEVGDVVKAYDLATGRTTIAEVTKTYHHTPEEMTDHYLIINDKLKVTPNHLLYIDGMLKPAGEVQTGDLFTSSDSDVSIDSIQQVFEQVPTYNFELELDTQMYYVENAIAYTGKFVNSQSSQYQEFLVGGQSYLQGSQQQQSSQNE